MAFIADYFVRIAERVDMTDETIRRELFTDSNYNSSKPDIDREREKGLDFFTVTIDVSVYPGNYIWRLFNDFIKIHSDDDFCLILFIYY